MRDQRIFRKAFLLILVWGTSLISSEAFSGESIDDNTDSSIVQPIQSSAASEKFYKLPPPGEDPRISYMRIGEKAFHSRDFAKARGAFEKVLELDSRDAQAHYFLGLIEYEEGNVEKAKARFQIAHECLSSSLDTMNLPIDTKQAELEFPEDYETRIYYKDGWYMTFKDPFLAHQSLYSLDSGSTYRIKVKSSHEGTWFRRGMIIGFLVALSFFLAR